MKAKSTAQLSVVNTWMGNYYHSARLSTHPKISLESNSVQTLHQYMLLGSSDESKFTKAI